MEEDDLLGGDLYQGQDLRHKLHWANDGEGNSNLPKGGNRFGRLDRGGFGNRDGCGFRGIDSGMAGGSGYGCVQP